MNYNIEVSRSNVTLNAFFAAIKKACDVKGVDVNVDREFFENPSSIEDARYFIKDGKQIYTYNGYTVEKPSENAPAKSEICRTHPLDYQTYVLNFDGSMFNVMCEFTFDDEKRGHGYYYHANRDVKAV